MNNNNKFKGQTRGREQRGGAATSNLLQCDITPTLEVLRLADRQSRGLTGGGGGGGRGPTEDAVRLQGQAADTHTRHAPGCEHTEIH